MSAHAATAPMLRFAGVAKSFGVTRVLADVDLEVARGEFFGLVGANGAGKTTLIKCLLDFCEPDGGTIEILGTPHRRPGARRVLAFLPERFAPPYYLTGGDFLRYALELHGADYREDDALAILAALDLEPGALARPVRTFSKGMTQKLGIAACLLAQKDLLVLDEPMSGLDPKARSLAKGALARSRDRRVTVFFTSHALADVEEMCDRMAVLHEGRVRFAGTPAELRQAHGAADLEQAFLSCIG